MVLLKEWFDYEETERKAVKAFRNWQKFNLVVTGGSGLIDGLAYTSSSDFAGLWDCNCQTVYKWDSHFQFSCVAISEEGFIVAHFIEFDDDKNEIFNGDMNIIIGRI